MHIPVTGSCVHHNEHLRPVKGRQCLDQTSDLLKQCLPCGVRINLCTIGRGSNIEHGYEEILKLYMNLGLHSMK